MKRIFFLLLVFIAQISAAHAAMLYQCIDSNGTLLITDSPVPDATCQLRDQGGASSPRGGSGAGIEALTFPSVDGIVPKVEVVENLDYTYYTADADSRQSLSGIVTASSPLRTDGRVISGRYDSQISWKLQWIPKPDRTCRIIKVTVELNGNITLPRLQGMTHAQRTQFDAFLSALRLHELGHHDISKDAAAAIGRRILALPAMTSCTVLISAANDAAQQTLREYKEKDVRYDAETRHGWTQGARFD